MENNSQFKKGYGAWITAAVIIVLVIIAVIAGHRNAGISSPGTMGGNEASSSVTSSTSMSDSNRSSNSNTGRYIPVGSSTATFMAAVPITSTNDALLVLSPNGGEIWNAGDTETFSWKIWQKILTYSSFDIFMVPQPASCTSPAACATATGTALIASAVNGLSYAWQAASSPSTPVGNYKADICFSGTDVCDMSDNYFTIGQAAWTRPRCPSGYSWSGSACIVTPPELGN